MATCEACNTIPPVVVENYVEKGTWISLAGLKVYTTGKEASTRAVVTLFDIFGPAPQTLQGADLLAAALDALVLVPDFFEGDYAQKELFKGGEENDRLKAAFMAKVGNWEHYGGLLNNVVKEGKTKWKSVEGWAALGLCWGGKVTALNSAKNTPFKVSAQVHPGRLAAVDAEKIIIPHIVLASNGEDAEVVKQYSSILTGDGKNGVVETYETMHHGWMGARANFDNPENLKEYERGYNAIAEFFAKHF